MVLKAKMAPRPPERDPKTDFELILVALSFLYDPTLVQTVSNLERLLNGLLACWASLVQFCEDAQLQGQ